LITFQFKNQKSLTMAEEKGVTQYRDMLDIIFANKNKAYGAYYLRRSYPKFLARAFFIGIGLIFLFSRSRTL
jgi:protein TonB